MSRELPIVVTSLTSPFPLSVNSNRILVTASGQPFLLIGESQQYGYGLTSDRRIENDDLFLNGSVERFQRSAGLANVRSR
jgi:hypothetical protein